MSLSKRRVQDKIEIVGNFKAIQIRYSDEIVENGAVISQSYHRDVVECGNFNKADEHNVRAIADLYWTEELIELYNEQE
tara:strand:+ start:499 stop:735 length:237 start_codon:yes stop_codon:yes gene_type:complete